MEVPVWTGAFTVLQRAARTEKKSESVWRIIFKSV